MNKRGERRARENQTRKKSHDEERPGAGFRQLQERRFHSLSLPTVFMDAKVYQQTVKLIGGLLILLIAAIVLPAQEFENLFEEQAKTPDVTVTSPELVEGAIDRIIDGDTVDIVLNGEVTRVRLLGIDTPETVDPRKPVQCFGAEASQHLKDMLANQVVKVEGDDTQGEVDKYGRMLAYLYLTDGTNVAEKMLRDGFAYEYTYDKPYELQKDFKNAEQAARDNESGLWSSETCGGKR